MPSSLIPSRIPVRRSPCSSDSDRAENIFHETDRRFPRLHTALVDQGYKSWLVEFAKPWFGIIVDIVQRPDRTVLLNYRDDAS